jgi:DNA-binding NtrC family response regulator
MTVDRDVLLNDMHLPVLPLRERANDVPVLLMHLMVRYSAEYRLVLPCIGVGARQALMAHAWPGDVRELENLAERLVVTASGRRIDASEMRAWLSVPHPRQGERPAAGL